jgi:predicted RNA-binding Zn-ribbon protein involved in translation (DUF1610 family)
MNPKLRKIANNLLFHCPECDGVVFVKANKGRRKCTNCGWVLKVVGQPISLGD